MSKDLEFSTTNLLTLLERIKNDINTDQLPENVQENIWNALTWNKNDPDNKEMIKYLFTGWWIYSNLDQQE